MPRFSSVELKRVPECFVLGIFVPHDYYKLFFYLEVVSVATRDTGRASGNITHWFFLALHIKVNVHALEGPAHDRAA